MLSLTFGALSIMAADCHSNLPAILYPGSHHLNALSFDITGLPAAACTTSMFPARPLC